MKFKPKRPQSPTERFLVMLISVIFILYLVLSWFTMGPQGGYGNR